jgi:hypothetical protein
MNEFTQNLVKTLDVQGHLLLQWFLSFEIWSCELRKLLSFKLCVDKTIFRIEWSFFWLFSVMPKQNMQFFMITNFHDILCFIQGESRLHQIIAKTLNLIVPQLVGVCIIINFKQTATLSANFRTFGRFCELFWSLFPSFKIC